MNPILKHLNSLSAADKVVFATRCGTSLGYLRKVGSTRQRIGETLCINLERESAQQIRCEDLRPDVDWAYLRSSKPELAAVASPTPEGVVHA